MSSDARAAASPLLSARVATEQNADDSVLEWTLGRLSLPPPSPAPSSFSVAGEQMHLEDLLSTSAQDSAASPPHSTKKEDDEAERLRLEALKAYIPSCLSNVLCVAPATVTGKVCHREYPASLLLPSLPMLPDPNCICSANELSLAAELKSCSHSALSFQISSSVEA